MKKTELVSQKLPLRLDKNITKNIQSFNDYIEGNPLIFHVIIYISKTYQRNFWNFGVFNPKDFASEWGYSTNYLRSVAPDPYHYHVLTKGLNKNESIKKIEELKILEKDNSEDSSFRLWDSILEDALYRLANLNIQLRNGGKVYSISDERILYDSVSSERILKSVTALYIKSKRGKPTVIYEYEVDNEFLINLSKLYVKIDQKVLIDLKSSNSKNLDTFYIFLVNLRDDLYAKESNIATPYFHVLSNLLGLEDSIAEPRNRKTKISKKIKQIMKYSPDLIESFRWIKENKDSKYLYQPEIVFKSKFVTKFAKKEYNNFEITQKFRVVLSNELKNTYDRITPREQRNKFDFIDFLQDPEKENIRKLALGYTVLITTGSGTISNKEQEMYNDFIRIITSKKDIYSIPEITKLYK